MYSVVFFPFFCINSLWGLEAYSRHGDSVSWLVPFVFLSKEDWLFWCFCDFLYPYDYFYLARIQTALWFILRYEPLKIHSHVSLLLLLKSKISFFMFLLGQPGLSAAWLVLYRPILEHREKPSKLELFILFILFSTKYNYPPYTGLLFLLNEALKKARRRNDGDPQVDIRKSSGTTLLLIEHTERSPPRLLDRF